MFGNGRADQIIWDSHVLPGGMTGAEHLRGTGIADLIMLEKLTVCQTRFGGYLCISPAVVFWYAMVSLVDKQRQPAIRFEAVERR